MKKILTLCGYNNAWAFKEVDYEKIVNIEKFVEAKHRKIADSFEEYRDIKPFEFLPGHHALILGIKAEILSMENSKKPKPSKAKKKNILDEDELKAILINQITTFSSNLSLKMDWSHAIKHFEFATDKNLDATLGENTTFAECTLSCPQCGAERIIRFDNKYWKVSNMCKHVRSHIENASYKKQTTQSANRLKKNNIKTTCNQSKKQHENKQCDLELHVTNSGVTSAASQNQDDNMEYIYTDASLYDEFDLIEEVTGENVTVHSYESK